MADDADANETQKFRAVHVVIASSGAAQPGELIALTREEFGNVKPLGSIEGDWRDKKPAKQPADAG